MQQFWTGKTRSWIDAATIDELRSRVPSRKRARPTPVSKGTVLQFRLRVMHQGEIALGPGKIDLLAAIETHGSLSKSAKSIGMSYMRAWTLVKVMNQSFRGPLVEMKRGGAEGGKAQVTALGRKILELYTRLVKKCDAASHESWTEMRALLKK